MVRYQPSAPDTAIGLFRLQNPAREAYMHGLHSTWDRQSWGVDAGGGIKPGTVQTLDVYSREMLLAVAI